MAASDGDAGGEAGEVHGVAADDGEVCDAAFVHDEAGGSGGGFQKRHFGADCDGFGDSADLELEVEGEAIGGAEFDGVADGFRETGELDRNAVGTGEKVGDFVVAVGVGEPGECGAGGEVGGGGFGAGDGRAGRVCDSAQDPCPGLLRGEV